MKIWLSINLHTLVLWLYSLIGRESSCRGKYVVLYGGDCGACNLRVLAIASVSLTEEPFLREFQRTCYLHNLVHCTRCIIIFEILANFWNITCTFAHWYRVFESCNLFCGYYKCKKILPHRQNSIPFCFRWLRYILLTCETWIKLSQVYRNFLLSTSIVQAANRHTTDVFSN